jgi:predicted PolB exonuclease-like 3'-5' exonuclease
MSEYICIDIETRPTSDPELIEMVRFEAANRQPARNAPKAEKDCWDDPDIVAGRAEKAVRETSLDLLFAEVLCVGVVTDGVQKVVECYDDEFAGLANLATTLEELSSADTVWVGHNIIGFDLPVLLNRFRKHQIIPPQHFPNYVGRWRGRVWDTMLRTPTRNGLGLVNMAACCRAYGLPAAKMDTWRGEPVSGAMVWDMYLAGDTDGISLYCLNDCVSTVGLFERQTFGGQWGTMDDRRDIAEAVTEIETSGMSESAKALTLVRLLDASGLIPRMTAL